MSYAGRRAGFDMTVPAGAERTTYGTGTNVVPFRGKAPPEPEPDPNSAQGVAITITDEGVFFDKLPNPAYHRERRDEFDDNLADEVGAINIGSLSSEYLQGVQSDILSRSDFIENYNLGIDLLGLKIEQPSASRGSRTTISKVKHPALLEACVRYQAGARAELLPPGGPVKAQIIGEEDAMTEQLAEDFGDDFNYYLTKIATEYYPDTDRALFYQAYGGSFVKKIFNCPIRRRPVSESVYVPSFIVSEDATDLDNAQRITNEILMSRHDAAWMKHRGVWREDVSLGQPMANQNPARRKILESQGLAPVTTRPQDEQYTIYEGYVRLDLGEYGFIDHRAPENLPVPYRVTVDKDSQQVLEVRRDWKKDDDDFQRRKTFVKFGLVPGLGFLDYGYLHLIGNQTRALTALLQLAIDAAMISNFPGGMKAKGIRSSDNNINPGLGEFVDVDLNGMDDIRKAIMGMPYQHLGAEVFSLYEALEKNVQRMAGAPNIESGAARTNVPVGTIMAMIEGQTQVQGAIHQRNHTSQQEELMLLREKFVENPEALTKLARSPKRKWAVAAEFENVDVQPVSDPNIPSQTHRIMQSMALEQLATGDPTNFNRRAVHKRTLRNMGIKDVEDLLNSEEQIAQSAQMQMQMGGKGGDGGKTAMLKTQMEMPIKQGQLQIEAMKVQNEQAENQRQAAAAAVEAEERRADRETDTAIQHRRIDLAEEQQRTAHLKEVVGMGFEHVRHGDGLGFDHKKHADEMAHKKAELAIAKRQATQRKAAAKKR